MSGRRVYDGCLDVASDTFLHEVERGDDEWVEEEVPDLDVYVTRSPTLRFTLDYPFDKPYEGVVTGDAGVTLRQIIVAIRKGFQQMYRGSVAEPIEGLLNQHVTGDYGEAMHVIDDLVIEYIDIWDAEGVAEIGIGS